LIPHLKAGFLMDDRDQWHQIVIQPELAPLEALFKAITNSFPEAAPNADTDEHLKQINKLGHRYLIDLLLPHINKDQANILLLVDQFEEIFDCLNKAKTIVQKDNARQFVSIILELSEQRILPVFSVLTMRSDFLGDCDRFYGLPEAMNQSQYLVPRMTREQRMEAIKGPAALLSCKLSDRLIQRLLNDSSDKPDHLPILQHALMRTWDEWKQSNDKEPDINHYKNIGKMNNALSEHANKIYDSLNSVHQRIAEKIFKAITYKTSAGRCIRRPTTLLNLYDIVSEPPENIREVIDQFRQPACTFLFPHHHHPITDDEKINITHESIMRVWDKLIQWVDEEAESVRWYSRLVDRALLKDEKKGAFLSDTELNVLMDWKVRQEPNQFWAKQYDDNFDIAMNYLEASEEQAIERQKEAEKAEQQRKELKETQQQAIFQKKIALTVTFFLVLALFLAGFSGFQYFSANKARMIAEQAKRDAEKARNQTELALQEVRDQKKIVETKRKEADIEREMAQNLLQEFLQLQGTLAPLTEKQGRLYISTIPKDSSIHIEGINMAYVFGMKIDEGKYTLIIRHNDYYPKTIQAIIKPGQEKKVNVQLIPKHGHNTIINSLGMSFVLIPAGTFEMGSPENEPDRNNDEKMHKVILTKPFYMQTTEVTQGQWKALMGNNPSLNHDCGDDCPVENVSWNDVQTFITKLNEMKNVKKRKYRLPTEAEWEYAARAGTKKSFFWGNYADCSKANYGKGNCGNCNECSKKKNSVKIKNVGSYPSNSWGLFDMNGNVWEWVKDSYSKDLSTTRSEDPIVTSGLDKVVRGSSWFYTSKYCRSAARFRVLSESKLDDLGFRLVVTIP